VEGTDAEVSTIRVPLSMLAIPAYRRSHAGDAVVERVCCGFELRRHSAGRYTALHELARGVEIEGWNEPSVLEHARHVCHEHRSSAPSAAASAAAASSPFTLSPAPSGSVGVARQR